MRIGSLIKEVRKCDKAMSLPDRDVENDEEREIVIKVFIPKSAYDFINSPDVGEGLIDAFERDMARTFEQSTYQRAWDKFSGISFEFVPIELSNGRLDESERKRPST